MSDRSPVTTVFIAYDFSDRTTGAVLRDLAEHPAEGIEAIVAGLEPGQDDLWEKVRAGIEKADKVLGYVDRPNANVGFELGYAAGRGKPILLNRTDAELPAWTNRPPFKNLLVGNAGGVRGLRKLLLEDGPTVTAELDGGDGTLLLSPEHRLGESVLDWNDRTHGWRVPEQEGWNLLDLPAQLAGIRRVVWVLLDIDETSDARDGQENAANGAIAGFALARGLELRVLRQRNARVVVDVGRPELTFESVAELAAHVEGFDRRRPPQGERAQALAAYFDYLLAYHANLNPFWSHGGKRLADVYVELSLGSAQRDGKEQQRDGAARAEEDAREQREGLSGSDGTLRQLLERLARRIAARPEPAPADPRPAAERLLVTGLPGAGKSTACRQLCHDLSKGDPARGPVPVFTRLTEWIAKGRSPLDLAAEPCGGSSGGVEAEEVRAALEAAAREPGRLWVFLDGLDELASAEAAEAVRRIDAFAHAHPLAVVLVTSRPAGLPQLQHWTERARILELDATRQLELLENWLPAADVDRLRRHLARNPGLAGLARSPLFLTLLARLTIERRGELPRERQEVYDRTIELLLERGHAEGAEGVREPASARPILAALALRMQQEATKPRKGREPRDEAEPAWDTRALERLVVELTPPGCPLALHLARWDGKARAFVEDVRRNSGILADHDGAESPWRFLHRSLGEFLAAEALAERGPDAWQHFLRELGDEVARWGETFALLAERLPRPEHRLSLLWELAAGSRELARRTLPLVRGLDPDDSYTLLRSLDSWDGDDLLALVRRWHEDDRDPAATKERILADISPELSTEQLAFRLYALEAHAATCDVEVDRVDFFTRCGRWKGREPEPPETVRIPPDGSATVVFLMGSPNGTGYDYERPVRRVMLSPYRIGRTTVTEEEFALFDQHRGERRGRPVTRVSWWEAWLYARWLGGGLPTEAQWECAARTGSDTPWSHGSDEKRLSQCAWHKKNSKHQVHEVAKRRPNSWGLYDVHGNVFEWCQDWLEAYDVEQTLDPLGPADGGRRVLRGGSYWSDADWCRSAFRHGEDPGYRDDDAGFRVVLSASPSD